MRIKDLQTGTEREYGTNQHDSLIVSKDGRMLTYYNLQNGDGSAFGDYRFTADGDYPDSYWNIGGMPTIEPERKNNDGCDGCVHEQFGCNSCTMCSRAYADRYEMVFEP